MLLSVIADYKNSTILKVLTIKEEYGELGIVFLDTSDAEQLKQVKKELEEGVTYADFSVVETKNEEGKSVYELRHSCTTQALNEPDFQSQGLFMLDEMSVTGLIRVLINEGGKIVLPLKDVPEDNIPDWMTVNPNTLQYTGDFGIRASHLIPGSQPDHWKWNSSSIVSQYLEGGFDDFTKLKFLVPQDFYDEDYSEVMSEFVPCNVVGEDGRVTSFKSFHITDASLPVYPNKSSFLMRTQTLARIKFAADAYSLALYSLTEDLFVQRNIETAERDYGYRSGQSDMARHVKFSSKPAITKKTADAMFIFLGEKVSGNKTPEEERAFLKKYPHYQVYESIIKPQIDTFFLPDTPMQQKMRAYNSLKNVVANLNLLLAECRYHMMFANNSFYLNMFTRLNGFVTDIPNYEVILSGGGIGWHRNDSF